MRLSQRDIHGVRRDPRHDRLQTSWAALKGPCRGGSEGESHTGSGPYAASPELVCTLLRPSIILVPYVY